MFQGPVLKDAHGRVISNLRISLTDLCNFRCVYCMPPEGVSHTVPPAHYLTREELTRFVRIAGKMGINRVRLTGGEPLLRQDILEIVRCLKSIKTVKDLSMTTNGSLLVPLIDSLKEAGLDRINISLDSINPARFNQITLSQCYEQVMKSVKRSLLAGFPVKLNMVVLNGLSAQEIISFVELAREYNLEARFLEFMPLCGGGWQPGLVYPISKVRSIVKEHFDLIETDSSQVDQVARVFDIKGGRGKVGFIASLTESFCDRCSRIRLSADGNIYPCLFSDTKVQIKQLLRNGGSDKHIADAIRLAASVKPKGNWFRDNPFSQGQENSLNAQDMPLIRKIGG